jgi:hypothetical protein
VRKISELSIGDACRIFFGYDELIGPLWKQVQKHQTHMHVQPRDMVSFVMTVSMLGYYGCSAKAYYSNIKDMYKPLRSDWGMSKAKFFAILDAFKSKDMTNRRFINELHANQRRHFGSLLFHPEYGSYPLDDDKLDMRSKQCENDMFVQQRHDASGGLGPVVHTMVSQLTGFAIGTGMNASGGGDIATVQELLRGMTGANTVTDIDCRNARLKIDRGYARPNFDIMLDTVNARRSGTQPRPSSKNEFPWTYGHPGRINDVSLVGQASYTEFAVRKRTFFTPARKHDTYGVCYKTIKENVVLATTQYAVKVPKHKNLQRGITKQTAVCEDFRRSLLQTSHGPSWT